YVFGGLRAGASGFLLKRTRPEELIDAVHTIAAGGSLLSPSVTRRVIDRMARQPAPELGLGPQPRRADPARARGVRADRARPPEGGERGRADDRGDARQDASEADPAQAPAGRPRAAVISAYEGGLFQPPATHDG